MTTRTLVLSICFPFIQLFETKSKNMTDTITFICIFTLFTISLCLFSIIFHRLSPLNRCGTAIERRENEQTQSAVPPKSRPKRIVPHLRYTSLFQVASLSVEFQVEVRHRIDEFRTHQLCAISLEIISQIIIYDIFISFSKFRESTIYCSHRIDIP